MQYIVYKFLNKRWLVPEHMVSLELTAAISRINEATVECPSTLTEAQAAAFLAASNSDEVIEYTAN